MNGYYQNWLENRIANHIHCLLLGGLHTIIKRFYKGRIIIKILQSLNIILKFYDTYNILTQMK